MKKGILLGSLMATVLTACSLSNAHTPYQSKAKVVKSDLVMMQEQMKQKTNVRTAYAEYKCSSGKMTASYAIVNDKVQTVSVKLNGKPYGVMEFSEINSDPEKHIFTWKNRSLSLTPDFDAGKDVPVMLMEGDKILAKHCELVQYK